MKTRYWTEHPVLQLGDTAGVLSPIREITVLEYLPDDICRVKVVGTEFELDIKSGYVYTENKIFNPATNEYPDKITYIELKSFIKKV